MISDGDLTIAESGAIVEFLIDRYGQDRLIPAIGTPERLRYTFWLHYAEGSVMPPLLLKLVFDRVETSPMPFFVRPIARGIAQKVKSAFVGPQLDLHLGYMERELAKSTWFCGEELTAADIQMSFPVEIARARAGLTRETRPHLSAYLARIHARPAFRRALETGGPYDLATA